MNADDVLCFFVSLQPPFYSRNKTEMYEKTLKKPLEFNAKITVSEAATDILLQVSLEVTSNAESTVELSIYKYECTMEYG